MTKLLTFVLVLLAVSSGCANSRLVIASRVVIAGDEVLLASEEAFPVWDASHQRGLTEEQLSIYRREQRPKVVASFASLTSAAQVARSAIELAAAGKVDPIPVARGVCAAVRGVHEAGSQVGWDPPGLSLVSALCSEVVK